MSITLKIDQKLLDEVKTIAENKFPLRNITSYAEATREALFEFVKRNPRYTKKDTTQEPENQNPIETATEESL